MSVRKHKHDVHTLAMCKSLLNKTWRGFVRRRHLNMWFEDEFFVACRVFEFSFGSMSGVLSEQTADVLPSANTARFLYSKKYLSIFFFGCRNRFFLPSINTLNWMEKASLALS